jgi:hypothetical protein
MQFDIGSPPKLADKFDRGLQGWRHYAAARGGRLWIFADESLDLGSWRTIQIEQMRDRLRLAWEREKQPVIIYQIASPPEAQHTNPKR